LKVHSHPPAPLPLPQVTQRPAPSQTASVVSPTKLWADAASAAKVTGVSGTTNWWTPASRAGRPTSPPQSSPTNSSRGTAGTTANASASADQPYAPGALVNILV
jgi:hypothetical protein